MCGVDRGDRLRRAVAACARSAVASKAAYMQALEQGTERALLARCTDRYALLERLIGLLVEGSMAPEQVRGLLDGIESDPSRYGSFERALAEARAAEAELASELANAVEEGGLTSMVESCFEAALASLDADPTPTAAAPSPAVLVLAAPLPIPARGLLLKSEA
jgi:hypothetical protein